MLVRSWSSISIASSSSSSVSSLTRWPFSNHQNTLSVSKPPNTSLRAHLSDQIADIFHNKVLISAGVSAAIGQLSKPFTSVFLYGKDFDIKATIQAGGFPSTHSSAIVAAATCLGLERGFSDSVFGLSVVYAGLVMYDAQGVRREVGIHARTLNKVLKEKPRSESIPGKDDDVIDAFNSQQGTSSSSSLNRVSNNSGSYSVLVSESEKRTQMQVRSGPRGDADEGFERAPSHSSLKESIGHTEVEVIAGALFGFLVSLAVNTFI